MKTPDFVANALKLAKANSPEILTALGVSGVITTSYLTGKAAYEASKIIESNERIEGTHGDRKERFKERAKHTWKLYIPAGVSGVLTIGCIIGASKTNAKRTTAAVTAYSLTERAFSEYREKVVEQLGEGKEQKIRDEIAQEKVRKNAPNEVILVGDGHILCCELYTGRYFMGDMEKLRKARNDINEKIFSQTYVSLDEFYWLLGLSSTCVSGDLGWDSDKLMELEFSTILSEDGRPCLAFEYNYVKPLV